MRSASNSVVTEGVVAFLKSIPPFQFLPVSELQVLAGLMSLEYFPKDTVILKSGGEAADSLYIVKKGGVKLAVASAVGKEFVLDMRSEGEIFGLLSLLSRETARLDVVAIEDTICYTIPGEEMQRLMSTHVEIADYLFRTSVTRYMDRSLNELREQTRLMGDGERLLYSLSVADVLRHPAVTAGEQTAIQDAARMMVEARATCLIVVDGGGHAVGIVTDRDFAAKVVARGLPPDVPVARIMSAPIITVESSQRVFEALVAMLGRDVHHLVVTENGVPKGVLTNHDLMLLQGKSPLSLVRHLDRQQSFEDLAVAQKRIGELLPLLMREGAKASHITRVIAGMNDRLMSRILAIAEKKLGAPPVPYCWVTMGSEGRSEQTFKTDQDNGLIYADGGGGEVEEYFAQLTAMAQQALEQCGYPPCPGGFMASNPRWRQSLARWQADFKDWITEARLHSVEDALIFFDMRPVAGDRSLFEALDAHNRPLLKDAVLFKSVLAHISLNQRPPLGFFRTFVLDRTGQHKDELDIKTYGTSPIVNAARLLAVDAGVTQTNTVDRLCAVERSAGEDRKLVGELGEAFEFLTLLRLQCQLRQARAGQSPGNYIKPETLTHLQRSMLKEAFQTIARVQSLIQSKFRSAVWSQLEP